MFSTAPRALIFFLITVSSALYAAALPSLVPSRRFRPGFRRAPSFEDIIPMDNVSLHYSSAPHEPAIAIVTFAAHPNQPILALEDVDHLLEGLSCSTGDAYGHAAIYARFASNQAYATARTAWSALEDFIVLTAHSTCNPESERGAWRVLSVHPGPDRSAMTLIMKVVPIEMRDVGRSLNVRYDHVSAVEIAKRGEHGFDDVFDIGFSPSIPARLPLFPPNITVDNTIESSVIQELTDAGVDLTCIDCGMKSNISIGLDFQVDLGKFTCIASSENCVKLSSAAMNLTVHELSLDAALEVYVEKSVSSGANYKVLWIPVGPTLKIPKLIDIGPAVGLEISFDLDVSANINFTYGASAQVASGAFASVSLVNSSGTWDPQALAVGWDQSGLTQTPLRVNGGEFNVSTTMSLAPFVEVAFTLMDVGAAVRLTADMPQLAATAAARAMVNRQCNTIGDDDFEYFEGAFAVRAGMQFGPTASLILEKGEFWSDDIPDRWDIAFGTMGFPLVPSDVFNTSSCFVLSDDVINADTTVSVSATVTHSSDMPASTSHLLGIPAPTGALYPAASAVPTWDFAKIESYYSANGHLPTNVNYSQMVQATTVPENLQSAISSAAHTQTSAPVPTSTQTPGAVPIQLPAKSGAISLVAKASWGPLIASALLGTAFCCV